VCRLNDSVAPSLEPADSLGFSNTGIEALNLEHSTLSASGRLSDWPPPFLSGLAGRGLLGSRFQTRQLPGNAARVPGRLEADQNRGRVR